MDREGMQPDALAEACRRSGARAVYCGPTMQNPTNATMNEQRRQEIAKVAERHGLAVIEDEINRPLHPKPPPLISTCLPEQSYLIMSASKAVAGGLRVGFVATPDKDLQRLTDAVITTTIGVSPLPVELFVRWLDNGTVEHTIQRRREDARRRQELAAQILEGYAVAAHPNSYYFWLELPEQWSSMSFVMECRRRGVVVTPSETFAIDQNSAIAAVRVTLTTVDDFEVLTGALNTIRDVLEDSPRSDFASV
jgi:DNA-binding transcriptional MocR family regulator